LFGSALVSGAQLSGMGTKGGAGVAANYFAALGRRGGLAEKKGGTNVLFWGLAPLFGVGNGENRKGWAGGFRRVLAPAGGGGPSSSFACKGKHPPIGTVNGPKNIGPDSFGV